jgi:hypothetical protein
MPTHLHETIDKLYAESSEQAEDRQILATVAVAQAVMLLADRLAAIEMQLGLIREEVTGVGGLGG